jgi:zinc protease
MSSGYRGSVIGSVRRLFGTGAVAALSEAQLLDRFIARGDETAFEAILLRHGPMVLGVCRRVLDDPHDVDDAFQATFLILVKKAGSIRDRDVLGTWLYGVARRVAVRARANARRRRACERSAAEGNGVADPRADRPGADELRSLIDDELERLPERYRAPLVLCDLEGRTHEQAAAQLRCPVGTVKSRLSRGRERLRSRLARRGLAPSAGLLAATLAPETASAVPAELIRLTIGAATSLAAGKAVTAGVSSAGVAALVKGVIRSMALSQLKFAAAGALAAVLAVAGARAIVPQAPAQTPRADRDASPPGRTTPAVAAVNAQAAPGDRVTERYQLENGLKVILRPVRGARQTVLVVVYSVGNDHDPAGRSGLAHLLEHIYVTAPAGAEKARTAEEFARRYSEGGNAQTGDRYTVFATSFPERDLDAEVRAAADRMGDLRVSAADLDRERPRLLEEVANMFGDFPPLAAVNNARELVRPTPGGGRHGGLPEEVRAITPEDVQAHWQRYYKPRNAIVALSGALDPPAARRAVERHFAKLAPGEKVPAPGEPGAAKFGAVKELAVKSPLPDAQPLASLAYLAPRPGSDLYAPFLVLVSRLWAAAEKLGNGGPTGSPVYFTPLDDGAVVGVTAPAKPGETAAKAQARLEAFVADTLAPKLGDNEAAATRENLGFLFGTADLPDNLLARNPYGVAFSLARREQLGLDPVALDRAWQAVTDRDLRRVVDEVFAPGRHAGAFISIEK